MAGPGAAQVSLEQDYTGADFSASLKSINPSILEGGLTGMFIGSYLQAVTPRLALGIEGVLQKPGGGLGPEAAISYAGKYKGDDWIASAQLLTQGGLQGSYWRRLTDKVETGVDVNLQFAGAQAAMMGGPSKEGVATLGAKYEFSRSIFRAQVDSKGKIGCLLEKVVAPPVRMTFAGEMDHVKVRISLHDVRSARLLTRHTELRQARPRSLDRSLRRGAHGAAGQGHPAHAAILSNSTLPIPPAITSRGHSTLCTLEGGGGSAFEQETTIR